MLQGEERLKLRWRNSIKRDLERTGLNSGRERQNTVTDGDVSSRGRNRSSAVDKVATDGGDSLNGWNKLIDVVSTPQGTKGEEEDASTCLFLWVLSWAREVGQGAGEVV